MNKPPKNFRAKVVRHNWRGGCNLCIGAVGYAEDSFVVITCSEQERRSFPIGTEFELTVVEETRGVTCAACGGSGEGPWDRRLLTHGRCPECNGRGRAKGGPP